jgi:hypothetical protein
MKPEILKSVDPVTGEKVSKVALPEDYKQEMDKVLGKHNEKMNQFMLLSQQSAEILKKWLECRDQIKSSDDAFKNKMRYIARKLKLVDSDPWIYNLTEKCFELREAPDLEPMTASHLKKEGPSGT